MIHETFPAMGTTIEVFGERRGALAETVQLFAEIEAVCSRFLPDSELSAINRRASDTVSVSPLMRQILDAAAEMFLLTDGLVDPAVGGRVADWGYDRTFELVRDLDETPPDRPIGRWELTGDELRLGEGVILDLGGIAKGWACDMAVERGLAEVVSAGGDIRSSHPDATAEIVDGEDGHVATVALGVGALATSAVDRRRWSADGRPVHHIIDPRTGAPAASPVRSASALAASAVAAEAGAKAMLIHGAEGLAWADRRTWLAGGVVVWHDGSVFATASCPVAA